MVKTLHFQCRVCEFDPWLGTENPICQKKRSVVSSVTPVVKNPPANAGDIRDSGSIPGLGRFPWRRAWQPIAVFLPGESHGQKSPVGYSLRGRKESDMTEAT